MDYETYKKLHAYCWQDLAAYFPQGKDDALSLTVALHGPVGELQRDMQHSQTLYGCRELTPREQSAAHLLAVISNHRAMTWQREPEPPGGKEPAPALTPEQNASAWEATRRAVREFAVYIPEREAVELLEAVQAPETATPAPVGAVGASGDVKSDNAGAAKPLQRTAAQDSAILQEIKKQGYDPLALPKNLPGKPGVKAAIRAALSQNSLFTGGTVFDKAWVRLTARADIAIQG